jgi:membrane protease YdiL (CAAX protease family)
MRKRSILEVTFVYVFILVIQGMKGVRALVRWENRVLGGSYFISVAMIFVSILIILYKKQDFHDYGIYFANVKQSFNLGFQGYLFLLTSNLVTSILLLITGRRGENIIVSIFLSFSYLLTTKVMIDTMMQRNYYQNTKHTRRNVIIILFLVALPLFIIFVFTGISYLHVSTLIWQKIFHGFCEETFYRGFIQSSINKEYGHPWVIWGCKIGPGLIVSSVFYGFSQSLTSLRFWLGDYNLNIGLVFSTFNPWDNR